MNNNPSNLSIHKRAEPVKEDLSRIIMCQLNGDYDMCTARAIWYITIHKYADDVEALAEAFTWMLNKQLVTTTDNIAHKFRHA